jgi:hypothetical protein
MKICLNAPVTYWHPVGSEPLPQAPSPLGREAGKVCQTIFWTLVLALSVCQSTSLAAQTKMPGYAVDVWMHDNFPDTIRFYCLQGYDPAKCEDHVLTLRRQLARYPISGLASWSFFLVPTGLWGEMVRAAGGPTGSPAFTALHSRETFFQDALFSPTALQRAQLMQMFHVDQDAQLELAVSHELGHALCRDTNEQRTAVQAENLRESRALHCKKTK